MAKVKHMRKMTRARTVFLVFLLAATSLMSASAYTTTNWLNKTALDHHRQGIFDSIFVVALDSRNDGTGGLPDSLLLVNSRDGKTESIPRDWVLSKLEPKIPLVQKYLGLENCSFYCGIQGIYSNYVAAHGGQGVEEEALLFLRDVVAAEYEIPKPALVVMDLAWARSFLGCIDSLKMNVSQRIPMGGTSLDGTLTKISKYIEPGQRTIDGQEMFWYARARFGSSDEDRTRRQRILLHEILKQKSTFEILKCGFLSEGFIRQDLKIDELPQLINVLKNP